MIADTLTADLKLKPFGPHALASIAVVAFLNVWEGAIRSGKTLTSLLAFLIFVEQSPATTFMMSGNTIGSLRRNVIYGDFGILKLVPGSRYTEGKNELKIPTSKGEKTIYCFGGGDAGSFASLRGATVGGWYADEVNRQHVTFIAEAWRRVQSERGAKIFWTLNADDPQAEIYTDYIDKYADPNARELRIEIGGFCYWFFTMKDNPKYSPEDIRRISARFSGFEKLRFLEGKRVRAEGAVYALVESLGCFQPINPADYEPIGTGLDFGTAHATAFYTIGHRKGERDYTKGWAVYNEVYLTDPNKTTETVAQAYKEAMDRIKAPRHVPCAISPDALTLRNTFSSHGLVPMTASDEVKEGLRFCRDVLYNGNVIIGTDCVNLRKEMGNYSYDPKSKKEEPIKKLDDGVDGMRYGIMTHIRPYM